MIAVLPWILAAASGLALALATPGPGLTLLAFLFPGLLLEAIERSPGCRRPWLLGWLAGTVFWVVSTNWVVPVMHDFGGLPLVLAIGCLVGMGAYLGLLWGIAAGAASLVPPGWRIWVFPSALVSIVVLQRFPPYGFTWTGAGSAFVDWPLLMASLPVWGASGLGWWAVATGTGLWGLARPATRRSGGAALIVASGLLTIAVFAAPTPLPSGGAVEMAVIQPGTTLEEKWDPSQSREIAERMWAMTAEAAIRGADIVLWPEGAVPYRLDSDSAYRDAVERIARELEVEIVLNSVGSLDGGGFANSAYLVTPEGLSLTRYDKVHLVPFGEFVPRWARVAFTDSLVREVGAFTPGVKPLVLPAIAPLGVAICFEVVFPDLPAAEVRHGAEILTTLTNDGWYGFSWASRQHFAQVRLRAAENQRWFVRAALTGISGFIDPSGRVVSRLEVGESGILVDDVQPMTGLTPRTQWGDWWAVLCAVATVAMFLVSRLRRRSRRTVTS
jgi:apolipoprotein N-acyltransferase